MLSLGRSLMVKRHRFGSRLFTTPISSSDITMKMIKSSVLLPSTSMNMRANAKHKEPTLHSMCCDELYSWQRQRKGPTWMIHDGPPYANGELHIGHFLNKVLKDIVNRYKIQRGFQVNYIPGWDCHGLPIELKALEHLKSTGESMSGIEIRNHARKWATKHVKLQKKQFQRWGVLGEWDKPYLTMDKEYESLQLQVFTEFFKKGLVFRDLKPVHWSPSSRTALAESELIYREDHESHACYVLFPLSSSNESLSHHSNLSACIWTTTPWTLPGNVAISYSDDLEYSIISTPTHGNIIIASDLIDTFPNSQHTKVIERLSGSVLKDLFCRHPFQDRQVPLVAGDHVSGDSGTGLVHTAPAHGQEDYMLCKQNGLLEDIRQFVGEDGVFTSKAGEELQGLDIHGAGSDRVIQLLSDNNMLVDCQVYKHRYPYDWRTKKPVIQRATRQWFINVDSLQDTSMKLLEDVKFIPEKSRERLQSTLKTRREWCISRQRHWGVPIPVFYYKNSISNDDEQIFMDEHTLEHLSMLFSKHGSDCWWKMSVSELLPERYQHLSSELSKGYDTLDVWFDSGSSWYVMKSQGKPIPCDLVIEGSDQHRGWFQSSLLTGSLYNLAPYSHIISHGFILDEDRRKMSKSEGNVINPSHVIDGSGKEQGQGAEILRYWVASIDYTSDVCIGPDRIEKSALGLRKLRNSLRFALGSVNDYNPEVEQVEVTNPLDLYLLSRLESIAKQIEVHYDEYDIVKVLKTIEAFNSTELSAFYFSACKDRLYLSSPTCSQRRSAQFVMNQIIQVLCKSLSPILPHLVAETDQSRYADLGGNPQDMTIEESIFTKGWIDEVFHNPELEKKWGSILDIRSQVYMSKEMPSNPLDSLVSIKCGRNVSYSGILEQLHEIEELSNVLQVSETRLEIVDSDDLLEIQVSNSEKAKCNRCWKRLCEPQSSDVADEEVVQLCTRCMNVLKENHMN